MCCEAFRRRSFSDGREGGFVNDGETSILHVWFVNEEVVIWDKITEHGQKVGRSHVSVMKRMLRL